MKSHTTSWIKAEVGVTLEPDDTLRTGDNSIAVITFFEGSVVVLEPGTQVSVAKLNIVTETGSTHIGLVQEIGRTVSRVKKLADTASTFEIQTPTCVAAVRGTIMLVDVQEDGTTAVGNSEGQVVVTALGVEVDIPVGMQSIVVANQPPGQPVQGLPFVPSSIAGLTGTPPSTATPHSSTPTPAATPNSTPTPPTLTPTLSPTLVPTRPSLPIVLFSIPPALTATPTPTPTLTPPPTSPNNTTKVNGMMP
jgi:hypothetical protein